MKKLKPLFTLILFSIFALNATPQTEKGKFILGGDMNFTQSSTSYSDSPSDKYKVVKFTAGPGLMIARNLAIGLPFSFSVSSENQNRNTALLAGPSMQLYIGKDKLKPFLNGGIGIGLAKEEYIPYGSTTQTSKQNLFAYQAGAGLSFFINNWLSLEFQESYSSVKYKPASGQDSYTETGWSFHVGLELFL